MWGDSYGENKRAGTAHHKPWEPCKSQFTVQTRPNSCYGRKKKGSVWYGECAVIDSGTGRGESAKKCEAALSWWAPSNVISAEYEMKFHFSATWNWKKRRGEGGILVTATYNQRHGEQSRWHLAHPPTPPLPSPPPPYCHSPFTSVEAPSASSVMSVYLQRNWKRGRLGGGLEWRQSCYFSKYRQKINK